MATCNAQTDGQVTRLKLIKRQRYGRVVARLTPNGGGLYSSAMDFTALPLQPALRLHVRQALLGLAVPETLVELLNRFALSDPHGWGHSERVAALCAGVCADLGVSEPRTAALVVAALLHDIGRLGVSNELLVPDRRFDDADRAAMRLHPIIGAGLIRGASPLAASLRRTVREHHEHWDGGGYPYGLSGETIGVGARLIAVCEAFDAMIDTAPSSNNDARGAALEELKRAAGSQFEPRSVAAVARALSRAQPAGATAR